MAPGNDVTFLWRHAVDRRFGAAVDNTRGVVIPSPHLLLRRPPVPRVPLVSEHRWSLSGAGTVEQPRGRGLNPPLGAPRRAINQAVLARFEDLGLVSPHALSSLLTISRLRPSTFTVEVIRVNER